MKRRFWTDRQPISGKDLSDIGVFANQNAEDLASIFSIGRLRGLNMFANNPVNSGLIVTAGAVLIFDPAVNRNRVAEISEDAAVSFVGQSVGTYAVVLTAQEDREDFRTIVPPPPGHPFYDPSYTAQQAYTVYHMVADISIKPAPYNPVGAQVVLGLVNWSGMGIQPADITMLLDAPHMHLGEGSITPDRLSSTLVGPGLTRDNYGTIGVLADETSVSVNSSGQVALKQAGTTDVYIGDRTVSPAAPPLSGWTATLTMILGWFASMIQQTTGAANWATPPTTTVNALDIRLKTLEALVASGGVTTPGTGSGGTTPGTGSGGTSTPLDASVNVALSGAIVDATVTATPSTGATITSATWDWGDGTAESDTALIKSHAYIASGNYTISITITDSAGQSKKLTRTVAPVVPANSPTLSIAAEILGPSVSTEAVFTPALNVGIKRVVWAWGDGTDTSNDISNPMKYLHTYAANYSNTPTTHTITLTVTDANGKTYTVSKDVTTAAHSGGSVTANLSRTYLPNNGVKLVANATSTAGQVVKYLWTFSDGTSSEGQTITKSFASSRAPSSSGGWEVRLTVMDAAGNTAQKGDVLFVSVDGADSGTMSGDFNISFFADADSGNPYAIAFTASVFAGTGTAPTYPLNYLWDFGDGVQAGGQSYNTINHTYSSNGLPALVTLVITDANGATAKFTKTVRTGGEVAPVHEYAIKSGFNLTVGDAGGVARYDFTSIATDGSGLTSPTFPQGFNINNPDAGIVAPQDKVVGVTYDWGDGNTESFPDGQTDGYDWLHRQHTYPVTGTFTTQVSLTMADGSVNKFSDDIYTYRPVQLSVTSGDTANPIRPATNGGGLEVENLGSRTSYPITITPSGVWDGNDTMRLGIGIYADSPSRTMTYSPDPIIMEKGKPVTVNLENITGDTHFVIREYPGVRVPDGAELSSGGIIRLLK